MTVRKKVVPLVYRRGGLRVLDQRFLPLRVCWTTCRSAVETARAITQMKVRGAPAIGIAAAYGIALEAFRVRKRNPAFRLQAMEKAFSVLAASRPTAVNLFWALERMRRLWRRIRTHPRFFVFMEKESRRIHAEDRLLCEKIGCFGAPLLKGCKNVLTHCNTGALATGGEGTALSVILHAARKNPKLHVWVDETRPYLQGGRLTAYELACAGVPFHIVTDSTAGALMAAGKVDAVIVGADRITRNGDTANKIGTYALALMAEFHDIPFYVAAPSSTVDLSLRDGSSIPMEERGPREILEVFGRPWTRPNYPAFHQPFDVTPARLISAVVCEKGVLKPPYRKALAKLHHKEPRDESR